MHLIGLYLMSVHLVGMHLIGMCFMDEYLMSVHLIGMHLSPRDSQAALTATIGCREPDVVGGPITQLPQDLHFEGVTRPGGPDIEGRLAGDSSRVGW
jgi:hypothetical protein